MTCFFCGDPAAHPATGAELGPRTLACRACTVAFWKWFRARQHSLWGGCDFYAAAGRWNEEKP